MPSVNPKLEKQASTEAVDPIRQAIIVVEHKIRNLEKRKARLETYRDVVKKGGELESEQKTAVAKYDEVKQTLDITRDLYKQIVGIANDAAKQQKKLARKEALERMQQDIAKVREVLIIQDALINMSNSAVHEDFLNGNNGATKLVQEDLEFLNALYNELMLKHDKHANDLNFPQQVQKVAEHYILIVDGKQREVVGTTYAKLKEIITSITQCGYFHNNSAQPVVEEVIDEYFATKAADSHTTEAVDQNLEQINMDRAYDIQKEASSKEFTQSLTETLPAAVAPVTLPLSGIPVIGGTFTPIPVAAEDPYMNVFPLAPIPHLAHQPQPLQQQIPQQVSSALQQTPQQPQTLPTPAQASRINDVIGPAPNFCFLQDSELDQPETTGASQTPTVISHIPAAPIVVAATVTSNAPIPTQTFTNQTFAAPHVVPTPVIYQSPEISHLATFGNANPPPPIPMPSSHQAIQFNQQNQSGFPQQQTHAYEQIQQDSLGAQNEGTHGSLEKSGNEIGVGEGDIGQSTSTSDWGDATENTVGDWSQDQTQQSCQDLQKSQAWGDQSRSSFRGRGGRRGNSNGFNSRPRGNYQQNGRNSYYRSNDGSNYQNGYQRNWNSNNGDGNNGGYNSNFKRSTSNQSRPAGPRSGDKSNMDRPNRGGGSQFRGSQRGGNRPNYAPRGNKTQTQN